MFVLSVFTGGSTTTVTLDAAIAPAANIGESRPSAARNPAQTRNVRFIGVHGRLNILPQPQAVTHHRDARPGHRPRRQHRREQTQRGSESGPDKKCSFHRRSRAAKYPTSAASCYPPPDRKSVV